MSKPKSHHFVPRWYLGKFADSNGFLHIYDRRDTVFRRQRVKEVMTVNNYYRQEWAPQGIDPNILEKALGSKIEPEAKSAFDRLLNDPRKLTDDDSTALLIYLEMQRIRVPRQAATAKQLLRSALLLSSPPQVVDSIVQGKVRLTIKDSFRIDVMRTLLGHIYPWFARMAWEVIEAEPGHLFVTSDSPVCFYNKAFLPPTEAGLGLAGTVVLFPIDPTHMLLMRHPEYAPERDTSPTRVLATPNFKSGLLKVTFGRKWSAAEVARSNWTTLQLADRFVVSGSKEVLEQCILYEQS